MAFSGVVPSFQPTTRAYQAACEAEKLAQLHNRLKTYTVRDQLGEGGYGSVYLADTYVQSKATSVAMKVIQWSRIKKPEFRRKLKMEVDNLKVLADTGSMFFPQIRECFGDDHNLYIVTDYLRGGSLRDEIERGPMSPDRIRFVAAQLVVALSQMHNAFIIHRDFKPDNIMLDALGNVTIIDFGMSHKFKNQRQQNTQADNIILEPDDHSDDEDDMVYTRCGTTQYQAPEVIRRVGYSYEADVWSFGVVLYEMLFGKRPFYGRSVGMKILLTDWRCPRGLEIDPVVADLLDIVMHKHAGRRATLDEVMAHKFFEGVDWDAVASRSYVLPNSFAPVLDWKPNRNGCIRITSLLDPNESQTSRRMKAIKPKFLRSYRIAKTKTKPLVARPENPRRFSSKVKKMLSVFKFFSGRSSDSAKKTWPVSGAVYVKPSLDAIANEAERVQDVSASASPLSVSAAPVPTPVPESILTPEPVLAMRRAAVERVFSEFDCSIESVHAYGETYSTAAASVPQVRPARPALLNTRIGLGLFIPASETSPFSLLPPSLANSTLTTPSSSAGPSTPLRFYAQASTSASVHVSGNNANVKSSTAFSASLAVPKPVRVWA